MRRRPPISSSPSSALRPGVARSTTRTREAVMSDESAREPIARAIRSLLVAADQRCPAIIGQAHLLYYARLGATPKDLAETCDAQLKRDIDGLRKALADVAAAMSASEAHGS